MKLAAALDDRLIIWWMDGVRYGVVDAQAEPLYGMKIGLFQRYFQQPGGFWKLAMFAVISLSLWHAAHRLRITAHDFGLRRDALVAALVYLLATLGTVASAVYLLRI